MVSLMVLKLKLFSEQVARILNFKLEDNGSVYFLYRPGFLGIGKNIFCRIQYVKSEKHVAVIFEKKYPWKDFFDILKPVREKFAPTFGMNIQLINALE